MPLSGDVFYFKGETIRVINERSDTCAAIFLQTKTRFKRVVSDDENPADWSPYSTLAVRYKTKLLKLTGSYVLSEETIEVYWGLRNLSALKDEASCLLVPKVDSLPYSDMLERLERRLITIVQVEDLIVPSQNIAIYKVFANAAILHIYMFQRDLSRGFPFFHLLSLRIRTTLETVDISRLKTQYPEVLLWVLMMGGLCGVETSERGWFTTLVRDSGCGFLSRAGSSWWK